MIIEWGGWGSNPRPADYESGQPANCSIASELGKPSQARLFSARFRYVFGMIKLVPGANA
jgi:hypothetical protein